MKDKLKIEVKKEYYDIGINHYFKLGEKYVASNNELSDFYHIWDGNKLLLIPKSHVKVI